MVQRPNIYEHIFEVCTYEVNLAVAFGACEKSTFGTSSDGIAFITCYGELLRR